MLALLIIIPFAAAATSPLLAWRDPVYIIAGFAGIASMALLLLQPLLAIGLLPGLGGRKGFRIHQWVGAAVVLFVVVHVAGLWITSPPDAIDALLFVSPTPFSLWGVLAMWGVFATACLALARRRMRFSARLWRYGHRILAAVIVVSSVVHAVLIQGTMESMSKWMLCSLLLLATGLAVFNVKRKRKR